METAPRSHFGRSLLIERDSQSYRFSGFFSVGDPVDFHPGGQMTLINGTQENMRTMTPIVMMRWTESLDITSSCASAEASRNKFVRHLSMRKLEGKRATR
jgi:hypothetical protein